MIPRHGQTRATRLACLMKPFDVHVNTLLFYPFTTMPRYLNVRKNLGYASIPESTKLSSYDKESGQAYTEVVCKAGPMRADWVWKARGTTLDITLFRHKGPGCSSLLNMSIRKACLHVLSLTTECFEGMEWQVAGLLWKRLVALYVISPA